MDHTTEKTKQIGTRPKRNVIKVDKIRHDDERGWPISRASMSPSRYIRHDGSSSLVMLTVIKKKTLGFSVNHLELLFVTPFFFCVCVC